MLPARRTTARIPTRDSRWWSALMLSAAVGLSGPSIHASPPLDEVSATRELCTAGPAAEVVRAERRRAVALAAEARVLPNPSLVGEHQRTFTGPEQWEARLGILVPLRI